jgi:hypothetical protein
MSRLAVNDGLVWVYEIALSYVCDEDTGEGGAGTGTAEVAALVATAEPAAFDAVTAARSVEPASACTTWYDALVAPEIGTQEPPEVLHLDQE